MPYRWTDEPTRRALTLWPHQSMTESGFAAFIGATALLFLFPLFAVLGSPILWVLLAFFAIAVAAVWTAIMRNRSDRKIEERLTLQGDEVHLAHQPPKGPVLEWTANPHWVRVEMVKDGPVENYLTLTGGPRVVEIGRFLTPEERADLYGELTRALDDRR